MEMLRRGKKRAIFGGVFAGLLVGVMLAGCGDDKPKMSEADKANFKGGPMPADYKPPTVPSGPPAAAGSAPGGAPPAAGAPAGAAAPATSK